jgi:hypothetical protein
MAAAAQVYRTRLLAELYAALTRDCAAVLATHVRSVRYGDFCLTPN